MAGEYAGLSAGVTGAAAAATATAQCVGRRLKPASKSSMIVAKTVAWVFFSVHWRNLPVNATFHGQGRTHIQWWSIGEVERLCSVHAWGKIYNLLSDALPHGTLYLSTFSRPVPPSSIKPHS